MLRPLFSCLLVLGLCSSGCGKSKKTTPLDLREGERPVEDTRAPAPRNDSSQDDPSRNNPVEPPSPTNEVTPSAAADDDTPLPPGTLPEGLVYVGGAELRERIRKSDAKATLVNVWASWCGPCKREFPMLVAVHGALAKQGVEVIFVSVDEPKNYPDALNFALEHGVQPPLLVYEPPLGRFKSQLHPAWPGMLPATFLFDAAGKVRYFWGGPIFEREILPVVDGLLRGEDIDGETRYGLKKGVDYPAD